MAAIASFPAATRSGLPILRSRSHPFRPLHIEKGTLKPSNVSYEEALPASCPDAPPPEATDAVLDQAKTLFAAAHGDCDRQLPGADPARTEVEQYTLPFRYSSDGDEQPERQARLFRFYCGTGAYNETHVYYQYDEDEGLREVQFATPELDIRYENDDTDGKVESVAIIGYTADGKLVNSAFDEASADDHLRPQMARRRRRLVERHMDFPQRPFHAGEVRRRCVL